MIDKLAKLGQRVLDEPVPVCALIVVGSMIVGIVAASVVIHCLT